MGCGEVEKLPETGGPIRPAIQSVWFSLKGKNRAEAPCRLSLLKMNLCRDHLLVQYAHDADSSGFGSIEQYMLSMFVPAET
jgi:hypothetical protein